MCHSSSRAENRRRFPTLMRIESSCERGNVPFSGAVSRLARKKEATIVSKSTSLRQFSRVLRRIVLIGDFVRSRLKRVSVRETTKRMCSVETSLSTTPSFGPF